MSDETSRVESWIYTKLAGDSALATAVTVTTGQPQIYADFAPQSVSGVWVIYNLISGDDTPGLGVNRVMARDLYQIRAYTRDVNTGATLTKLKTAADRIDELIGKAVANVHSGYVFSARRTAPRKGVETDTANNRYMFRGGLYRIDVSEL